MAKKNKHRKNSTSGTPTHASNTDSPPPSPPKSSPLTAPAPGNDPSLSGAVLKASSSSVSLGGQVCDTASTVLSRIKTIDIASPAAEDVSDDSEDDMEVKTSKSTSSSKVVTKSDSGLLEVKGTSDEPGPSGKKKRDPLNSPDSSDADLGINDRLQLGEESKLESPFKKRKFSGREDHDTSLILSPAEPVIPEQLSGSNVISNIRYKVPTPEGDYWFYGPRREFTIVSLMKSQNLNDLIITNPDTLPSMYHILIEHPEDSCLVNGYRSHFSNRDDSAYKNHQMIYLFYLFQEKKRICDSDTDNLEPLPDKIEIGMKIALTAAVDKIRDGLIYRTLAEQDNVFNQEFYCSHHEDGYKPPFSNTTIYQQIDASESMLRIAILLLALADAAMDNIRLVAGIGYCYIARRVITEFRLLSLLEQPYKVLDHVIRQKVSGAIYALELYTKKDARVVEKPFNDICECFTEITFTLKTMTKGRACWEAFKSFKVPDHNDIEPEFLAFTTEMINPFTHWTIDEHLAWTTDVVAVMRTARKMSSIHEDIETGAITIKKALKRLLKHYNELGYFEIDFDDHENKHLEALVSNFGGLSFVPLLECFKGHEVDEMATQIADDLTNAIEAERKSEQPNPDFFKQMLKDQMVFMLLRLFYYMWEIHKPKDVTRIRLKLLGIRQAAELLCNQSGDCGKYSALVALSSIMYLDYTCGMVSKASEISVKTTRQRCHDLAKKHLVSNEHCKDACLSLLALKMEEIQRASSVKETEDDLFERGCWILKIATLSYPVLSYFHAIPKVKLDNFPKAEKPADESYTRKRQKYRPLQNGQKLLYLSVPYEKARNIIKTQFLKLEEETYADTSRRKHKRTAAADSDDSLPSDDDENDIEEEVGKASSEEQGNARLFLVNLPPLSHCDARGSSSTTKPLPNVPTRETMAAAFEKFTRPSEAVGVMLEPLRSESPITVGDSCSRPESNTPTSESSGSTPEKQPINETEENLKKFKPIDLENFYKVIANNNGGYPLKIFAFGSSTFEETFAKTLILNFHGDAEEKFKNSLASVLGSLLICVNKILPKSLKECDYIGRQHWKKWQERIVIFTNRLKEHRINPRHDKELLELMYNWSVVLGFPTRTFVNPN